MFHDVKQQIPSDLHLVFQIFHFVPLAASRRPYSEKALIYSRDIDVKRPIFLSRSPGNERGATNRKARDSEKQKKNTYRNFPSSRTIRPVEGSGHVLQRNSYRGEEAVITHFLELDFVNGKHVMLIHLDVGRFSPEFAGASLSSLVRLSSLVLLWNADNEEVFNKSVCKERLIKVPC